MGSLVMKESRESDLYVGWNTTADGISFVGTRSEALEYLWNYRVRRMDRDSMQPEDRGHPENLMQRCDILGTTSYFGDDPEGGWSDTGFVYNQQGWATREAVFQIARRFQEQGWDANVDDLLTPFEDDE